MQREKDVLVMSEVRDEHVPSTAFQFHELDTEALTQLHDVLDQVEQGRGTLAHLAGLMGGAVGRAAQLGLRGLSLAPGLQERLESLETTALEQAYRIAILGLDHSGEVKPNVLRETMTHAAIAAAGAFGGFGGVVSMAPDIGFTTLAIMREIASIARENGEDLRSEETRRACLEVFALRAMAGKKDIRNDEEGEIGFFAARALMRGQPLVMLMADIAGHYGMALSRKLAAQMVPVAGALCGAAINSAFFAHYRAVAKAHFTIRRLERVHGMAVQQAAEAYQGTTNGVRGD